MKDRTFAIIKPDAVNNGHTGNIYDRIQKFNFKVIGAKLLRMSQEQAEGFYGIHKERPFFNDLIKFMTSGPCMVLALEKELGFNTVDPWEQFTSRMEENKDKFLDIIGDFREQGLKIAGLGASTKGNVTLQTWGIGKEHIKMIGDVNPDKTNCFTPGTWIPIDVEDFVLEKYDVFVILPWHFRNFFVRNEKFKGKTLVFPLPTPEVVVP